MMRKLLTALAVASVGTSALPAAACDVGSGTVGYGFALPQRTCDATIHFDMTTAGYVRQHDDGIFTRIGGEAGLLMAVGDTGSQFHIGPIFALGFGGFNGAFDDGMDDVVISPRARARLWLLDDWVTFEAAIGPSIAFTHMPSEGYQRREEWLARPGFYAEFGPAIAGALGVYAATEYASPADGRINGEFRMLLGVRTTLSFAAVAALLGGYIYACAEVPGGC
jgi:hypothetical protein